HHRVADELLDGAAVEPNDPAAGFEVAREQLAHLLGVACLRKRCEADEVSEENRHEPALGRALLAHRRHGRGGVQRGAALTAEAPAGPVRRTANRTGGREGLSALCAELAPLPVLG